MPTTIMTPIADPLDGITVARVAVAIEDAAAAGAALETAAQLAVALHAELCALFVENAALARAAALPFLRETGSMSAAVGPLVSLAAVRDRELRGKAAVAATAKARGLPWRFDVLHDTPVAALVAAGQNVEALVLDAAGGLTSPCLVGTALAPDSGDARPVVVAVADRAAEKSLVQAGLTLAEANGARLIFLVPAGYRLSRAHAAYGRQVTLSRPGLRALGTSAREFHARLLVCRPAEDERGGMQGLMARVRCPVVLVR